MAIRFTIVTIFPEFFDSALSVGLLGKAVESGLVTVRAVTPREQTTDRHQTVDDKPYGGGPGLVMMAEPLSKTLRMVQEREPQGRMLYMSPRGRSLDQALARDLAREEHLTIVCGRYEGVDERLLEGFPLEHVSVGDVVLNGGESGALCLVEAVSRLLPDFMHKEASLEEESFSSGLLEYPHYTRPEVFEGQPVPEILRSGDHARIARWRREQALAQTLGRRPGLLASADLSAGDLDYLKTLPRRRRGRNLYIALTHWPMKTKLGETGAVSLTNLDIHDIARVSRTYGLGGVFILTPLEDQRRLARTLLDHWTDGPGKTANPDRGEALSLVTVAEAVEDAVIDIEARTGQKPRLALTSARAEAAHGGVPLPQAASWLDQGPVLLVLGTGHGMDMDAVQGLESYQGAETLRPVRCLDGYNHLPVRAAAAILVDRLLGDVD